MFYCTEFSLTNVVIDWCSCLSNHSVQDLLQNFRSDHFMSLQKITIKSSKKTEKVCKNKQIYCHYFFLVYKHSKSKFTGTY